MNIDIQATDQYNRVEFMSDVVDANDFRQIEEYMRDGLGEAPYVILDFDPIRLIGFEAIAQLKELESFLRSEEGMIVIAALDPGVESKLQDTGITMIPTIDEAIDYVFMDRLEKELGAEGFDE